MCSFGYKVIVINSNNKKNINNKIDREKRN